MAEDVRGGGAGHPEMREMLDAAGVGLDAIVASLREWGVEAELPESPDPVMVEGLERIVRSPGQVVR